MNNIRIDISESIATRTVDRPSVKNALDFATVTECHRALDEIAANPDVGVLIITGAGETSFVSGADINDIRARDGADGLAAINSSLFAKVDRLPKPVIAAINGYALGGGCELAKKILRQGPLAARLAKLALNASARVDLDSGLLIETLAQALCYQSADKQEGTTAFLEKRKPKFSGR